MSECPDTTMYNLNPAVSFSSSVMPSEPVYLRFYDGLNDFLAFQHRFTILNWQLMDKLRIKELIAEIGIPFDAIGLILVDGDSVDLDHILQGGERVSVCPVFEDVDIGSLFAE